MKAFPIQGLSETVDGVSYRSVLEQGMDLRDYFAAKALNGICAGDWKFDLKDGEFTWVEIATKRSYEIADAMMEAR
jgi:hypothetical protein